MTDNTPMLSSLVEEATAREQQTGNEPAFNIYHPRNMRELLLMCIEAAAQKRSERFGIALAVAIKLAVYLILIEKRFDRNKWEEGFRFRTAGGVWVNFDLDLVLADRKMLDATNELIACIRQEYYANHTSLDQSQSGQN